MAAIPESYSHVLAEFECLSPLLSALRLDSSRLKCTCIGISRKWLALGSSGGGLNLIQKDCWKQRLFLTHKEGAISSVAFCLHDEDYVAVATSQGVVVVWELNQERRGKPERIYISSEHKGRKVTALCWDTNALRVFVGDHVGKVSVIKINSSKQGKAATAFVMFPIHIITTVDSRVVQLDYLDGRLLISSLTRSYLCDTEREKFWKIGNKERDGEYGACFFPVGKSGANQQSLIYCARPGSRIWEVNFEGEVLSTHQFKQLLSAPSLPVITIREDPEYNASACSPQSLAFPKLLYLSEHCIMTWTERAIYIIIPQNVQVLLWSEVKDIYDIAIYKNELFCLHTNGKVSHLSLLTIEKCVERLLRRSFWTLAAKMCCLFQNSIVLCRARKLLPADKLEHLKSQLDLSTETDLITQLEELISKLEPLDSACSSRRSSISSHESFSILDSGIYRVISRRNSQSDEDSCSLHSQTLSEDERLKEFHIQQEEEQLEHDSISHASLVVDNVRSETFLPFSIPLSFRSPSPLVSLQAVKESVSSFVRKTTEKIEKIGTLHLNPDRIRQDVKDEEPLSEVPARLEAQPLEKESRLQDPLVLLQPQNLTAVLLNWIPFLEETCGLKAAVILHNETTEGDKEMPFQPEDKSFQENALKEQHNEPEDKELNIVLGINGESENPNTIQDEICEENTNSVTNYQADNILHEQPLRTETVFNQPYQIKSPFFIPQNIKKDLTELATLCFELNVYESSQVNNEPGVLPDGSCALASKFIRDYFFLLDLERLKRCIITCHNNHPEVWDVYMEGLKELTLTSPVTVALENGDIFKTLKLLVDLGPWDAPLLLAHAERLYKKFRETSLRPLTRFYPLIGPSDIKQICKNNPEHFLAYLDSLIKSKAEDKRLSFLRSLLHPDSLQLEWLCLAMSHDAPHKTSTMDAQGNPWPHSHLFTWGYNQLILLLLNLPTDVLRKEKMTDICQSKGFWPGYLSLCLELDRRSEVFTKIVHLDDMELLNTKDGTVPKTIEEWKFLLCLVKSHHNIHVSQRDTAVTNGTPEWSNSVTVENVALLAARIIGPDRSLQMLQECDLVAELSERFAKICEILRIAEKRQRALIQSMLERCDRFLWSQQA
ncbi:Hermansky-Pudlak syndrome 5 protein isoform X2 [Thamnophis elegans]|uniref:Hermansky-Pudlak syndrome 5 protein isoform X2 n=1 Tax=Thamnophis elegans TaxID=35005 RepID=UPI001378174D|nr:Hermansky-Pudlak syndrome 5 protein isoform X2 [Thamnophis elegans]